MGWNSWNHFGRNIDDATVRAQADAMVTRGLRDAGYVYINIDDTWQGRRDALGFIHPNERFPDMKALADYLHDKGLKFGLYSSPGPKTCAGFEGSYGHEDQDAHTYANWGVDYLKYDLCSFGEILAKADSPEARRQMMLDAYRRMHDAIQRAGRPIVYSLCQYGLESVWKWGASVGGNLWRTTGDISDSYRRMATIGFNQLDLARYAAPGHWNDPDMLEVGNGGMSLAEYQTHMSLWALLAAPLLAGSDLTALSPEALAMLTNRDVIAIDQDSAGIQADRLWAKGAMEVWAKPLHDGSKAVGFFNRSEIPGEAEIAIALSEVGFRGEVSARDAWEGKDLGALHGTIKVRVPAHGAVLLRIRPTASRAAG